MFLATTALAEFWDVTDRLLFLGPWCTLSSQADRWSHLDYQILPSPWDDRERLHRAGLYCRQVFEQLLADLTLFLNSAHRVAYRERYWRILVGPWLLHFIDAFYDRYVCVSQAFAAFPELRTLVLAPQDYLTVSDFIEFDTFRNHSDLYNLQLFSQIIQGLGYDFPQKKAHPLGTSLGMPPGRNLSFIKAIAKNVKESIIKIILDKKPKGEAIFLLPNLKSKWSFRLFATPGFQAGFLQESFPPDWRFEADATDATRRALSQVSSSDDPFVQLLVKTLPINFPYLYLEGFHPSRQWLKEHYPGKQFPKLLITLAGLWFDRYGRFLAAEVAQQGGKIINLQHGAGYGMARLLNVEQHDRDISDRFYCWGWAQQENDDLLANLPSPKLSGGARPAGASRAHRLILMASTTYPRYLYRFQSYPVGSHWERYIQATETFLQKLSPSLKDNVLYRGHGIEFGWHLDTRLRARFPWLAIDDHRHGFAHWMAKSRLVVLDHPGTTLLEALAANVPVILFFYPESWEMREAALPYFEALRRVGILHSTPEAAVKQVGEVYENIDDWWSSLVVQEARRQFVQHFAWGSKTWNRQWADMVRREIGVAYNQ
ncbi:MAG: LIC12162 family protein [Syntrophobacterales bacterium]|jgi:putative transferase (TIGR04331 family)|nr:LIC12162 family protein [Syntrophobacterales bacterium]